MLKAEYNFKIELSKDNKKVLKIEKNKKWIFVGSKYDAEREINKILELLNENLKNEDVIFVYGFGAGEHISKIKRKYKNNKVVIFEPNIKLYEYISTLKSIKSEMNLDIIYGDQDKLKYKLKELINEYNYKNSKFISFSNYNSIFQEESKEYYDIINHFLTSLSLNINTKLHFDEIWFENLIKSIPYFIKSIPSDLYNNQFKNKPAIIVSAGPSLTKNINLLTEYSDNALIVTGGRTLQSLINKLIKPDLLVIADSNDVSYTLVKNYLNSLNIPLLFYEGGNLQVIKEHDGLKLSFSYNDLIFRIFNRKISHIHTGGSVAHAMTSYVINLGCNPIIFIGQDFAYTGLRAHSELAQNEEGGLEYEQIKQNNDVFVEDINGEMVRTSIVLNDYRESMEKIIKLYPETMFINATEGGAKIEGTFQMKLQECLSKYCNKSFDKITPIEIDNKTYLCNAKKEVDEIKIKGKNLYNKIKYRYNTYTKTNKALHEDEIIIADIFNLYINDSAYALLLYSPIFEFARTDNNKKEYEKINNLYFSTMSLLENALKTISDTALELKNVK